MPASWHLRLAPCPPKTLLRWICLQYHQGGASGELSPRSQCLTGSTAHPCSGSQLAWFSLVSFSLAKPLSSITIFFPCSFLYNLTPKKRLHFLKKCGWKSISKNFQENEIKRLFFWCKKVLKFNFFLHYAFSMSFFKTMYRSEIFCTQINIF